jgi:hypothetical protein
MRLQAPGCIHLALGVSKNIEKTIKPRKLKKPNGEKKPIKSIRILKKPTGSASILQV